MCFIDKLVKLDKLDKLDKLVKLVVSTYFQESRTLGKLNMIRGLACKLTAGFKGTW